MAKYCILLLACIIIVSCWSCSENNPAGPEKEPVCFTVSQYTATVTVDHFWNSGASQQIDLSGGATEGTVTVTRENESHTLHFTNIYKISGVIQSFDVVIDGKSYSYPENKC
jgi:hypothetical protein